MDTSFSRTNMMNVCEPGFGNTGLSAGVFNKISIDGDSSGEIQGWFEDALKDWEMILLWDEFSIYRGFFIDDSSMNGKTYPIYRGHFIDDSSMNGKTYPIYRGLFIDDSSMNGKTYPIYREFFIDNCSINWLKYPIYRLFYEW
ncbi:hypothetical protein CDAR_24431 [Caerostris darwini]|uniref:Uncharacterized protein n=1 Tax=Caerostris darwini TaxID=1538125 RepID=A0AAV4QH76_9ARAC|nr:hypothetical protein CDAR_24431 [Caerostris darwini]